MGDEAAQREAPPGTLTPPSPPPQKKGCPAIDLQSVTYKDRAGLPAVGNVPKHVEKKSLYLIHFPGFVCPEYNPRLKDFAEGGHGTVRAEPPLNQIANLPSISNYIGLK